MKTTEIAGKSSNQAVVLLHGYGANRQDLAPLAGMLAAKASPTFLFPDAPEMPPGLALSGGRAWFQLDLTQIQVRAANPAGPLYDSGHVARLQRATDEVLAPFLWKLTERFSSIVLGGFSQGAMLALDWAWRHYDPSCTGLVLFSGAWPYLNPPRECRLPNDFPVFLSHGTADPVLRYSHSERLRKALDQAGAKVENLVFGGGHEIPLNVIARAQTFLDKILAPNA